MSHTLRGHRVGLLNWYDHPISTSPLEGTNNKIGLLQRRAYGYRRYDHFKLRLLTPFTTPNSPSPGEPQYHQPQDPR